MNKGDAFARVPVIALPVEFRERARIMLCAHDRPHETNVIDLTKGVTE